MSNKKNQKMSREAEMQAAQVFGKHVSKEKGRALLAVTFIACALPIILGVRLWDQIPEIVRTGLIGVDGKDDSMPRWAVVFALPGLMCLLDLIAHFMLALNQKRMTLPPMPNRIIGRWGFPVISVLFCSGMILESSGQKLTLPFMTPCIIGLILLLLGGHMWDCPRDAKIALRFSFTECSDAAWSAVHRFASWIWMAAGLVIIAGVMVTSSSTAATAVIVVVALAAPFAYGKSRGESLN